MLSLAFPIGVIGSELDRAYRSHYYTLVQKAEERQKRWLGRDQLTDGLFNFFYFLLIFRPIT